MKILVLENDPKELVLIQKALSGNRNILIPIFSSDQAWQFIQAGDVHFLIGNWDTSDLKATGFIRRVRAAKLPFPLYILLTSSMEPEQDAGLAEADDVIVRPYRPRDLKNRVAMAERIVSLSTNLASARTQLESQAVFDPVTGFMNRTAFLRQATGELERSRRASVPLSMIALEIENFKLIHDKFGTPTANDVLNVAAQAIREKSRPYDCIGRWTGNEFILLIVGVIGADAEKITERIISGMRGIRVEVANQDPLSVRISAGVASVARVSADLEVEILVEKARQATLRAKESGGNQVYLVYV